MSESAIQYHNVNIDTFESDNDNYSEHDTSINECYVDKAQDDFEIDEFDVDESKVNTSQDDSEINESDVHESNVNTSQDDFEIDELRRWAVACNIPSAHLDKLLLILRKRLLPQLPKSSVTFLNTTGAIYNIKAMKGVGNSIGEYVYLGIENGLNGCVDPKVHTNDSILLQINVDGASPYDSSTKQLWPILCKVLFNPNIYSPFPVALYYGDTKPGNVDEYMNDFIEEINLLQKNGVVVDKKNILYNYCI